MNYETSFINRAKRYCDAVNDLGYILDNEFTKCIEILNLQHNDVLVNVASGGIPLEKYIDKSLNIHYIPIETNTEFSKASNSMLCSYDNLKLLDNSIDKIIIHTNLHHCPNNERILFYKECYRVLKNNGKFIIGDVLKNSNQDNFLNIFVNQYNSNGHNGIFFTENDKELIEKAGFTVETKITNYKWFFENKNDMIEFTRKLFGLDKLDDDINKHEIIYENIQKYLDIEEINNKYYWNWTLIYFIGTVNSKSSKDFNIYNETNKY